MGRTASSGKEKMSLCHVMFIVTCCVMMAACTGMWFTSADIFCSTVSEALGVGLGQLSLYITLSYVATTIFPPFAGRLLEKFSARTLYAVGTVAAVICGAAAPAIGIVLCVLLVVFFFAAIAFVKKIPHTAARSGVCVCSLSVLGVCSMPANRGRTRTQAKLREQMF